jgi:release factor glutamine methyltransferase
VSAPSDHSRALLSEAATRLAAAGIDTPRLDARVLWERAHSLSSPSQFEEYIVRRCAREPLAYITGHKEFWSLDFEVGPGVLVPRPETETIIEQALALLPDRAAPLKVLDLGTGSGCLLVAFLNEFPKARGLGIDSSEKARRYATANMARHGLSARAEIRAGNWAEDCHSEWDVILSNPPYIPLKDISALEPEVQYEPQGALDGGADGLDSIRRVGAAMARLLTGIGLMEIGAGQAAAAGQAMTEAGLVLVRTAPDLAGIPRVVVTRPAAQGPKKVLESGR